MELRKRKIKYPLKMKDDFPVRTVEEFREHFDLVKMLEYAFTTVETDTDSDGTLKNAKLTNWLRLRYYEDEADAISELCEDDTQLAEKLCRILGAEYPKDQPNISDVQKNVQRRTYLRQLTTDAAILSNTQAVAMNQDEFERLYQQSQEPVIYLLSVEHKPFVFRKAWLDMARKPKPVLQGLAAQNQGIKHPVIMPEGSAEESILRKYFDLDGIEYQKSREMIEAEKEQAKIAFFGKELEENGLQLGSFVFRGSYTAIQDKAIIWQKLEEDEEGFLLGTILSIDKDSFKRLGLDYIQAISNEGITNSSGILREKSSDPFHIKMPYSYPISEDLRSLFIFDDYPITFLSKDEKNKYISIFNKGDYRIYIKDSYSASFIYREETFRKIPKLYINIFSDNDTYLCYPVIYLKKETLLQYYLDAEI